MYHTSICVCLMLSPIRIFRGAQTRPLSLNQCCRILAGAEGKLRRIFVSYNKIMVISTLLTPGLVLAVVVVRPLSMSQVDQQ